MTKKSVHHFAKVSLMIIHDKSRVFKNNMLERKYSPKIFLFGKQLGKVVHYILIEKRIFVRQTILDIKVYQTLLFYAT